MLFKINNIYIFNKYAHVAREYVVSGGGGGGTNRCSWINLSFFLVHNIVTYYLKV